MCARPNDLRLIFGHGTFYISDSDSVPEKTSDTNRRGPLKSRVGFWSYFYLNLLTKSHGHICPVLEPSCRQSNSKSSMQRIRVHFASKKRQILELPPSVKTSLSNLKQLLGTFCGQNSIETVFFLLAQLKQ